MKALEEIKAQVDAATLHQVLDPGDYAEMAWESVAAASKLIAALEAVEERLTWLDAIQEGDNNTPKNANAGGVASFIRGGIKEALA